MATQNAALRYRIGVVLAPTFGVMLWMMWAKAYGIHGAKRTEAKVDLFDCIELLYTWERHYSTLRYKSSS
ncbi:MAG: hypothetical protein EPO47_03185 [Rugosibacter sp.]|nr:MAG: hypothetical protein EPO60_04170 [Rugosibacter sp.]TBR10769.1 MAG: hypothetical protein EPO47_03185 [Rugosibacter sp.]